MSANAEFLFLQELRFLSGAALTHGEQLQGIAQQWTDVTRQLESPDLPLRPRRTRNLAERNERTRLQQERVHLQGDAFVAIEAFLSAFGRISMIVFPTAKGRLARDRGARLAAALGIDRDHPIAGKQLRNKWTHFDELIDELGSDASERLVAQRFVASASADAACRKGTIRLLIVDTLVLDFRGVGEFDLAAMIRAVEELATKVTHAIGSWGEPGPQDPMSAAPSEADA